MPARHLFMDAGDRLMRSEEHTSELQSLRHLVCRLLLEKKKNDVRARAALLEHLVCQIRIDREARILPKQNHKDHNAISGIVTGAKQLVNTTEEHKAT